MSPKSFRRAALALAILASLAACDRGASTPAAQAEAPKAEAPPAAPVSGIDLAGMDTSVAAGDDFNAYANGAWDKATPIPDDRSSTGIFLKVFELAEKQQSEKRKDTKSAFGNLRPGQVVNAKIVGFSADSVFLDVGAKAEAVIPKADLADETGELHVKECDIVEARVRKFEGGTVVLTKVLAHQSIKNRESLREAYAAGLPIEGKVTEKNKGGFDVEISGMRAFCPQSQIDLRPQRAEEYIGKKFPFKIVEFKDGGRNIVVSRLAAKIRTASSPPDNQTRKFSAPRGCRAAIVTEPKQPARPSSGTRCVSPLACSPHSLVRKLKTSAAPGNSAMAMLAASSQSRAASPRRAIARRR